jgi:UDP-2,4-diacetamido-2,4,6-trideoxy-beta-L-altropyranose hydrolase
MKVVVRTDASVVLGTGHVMRCLTLTNALRQLGHEIAFVCRDYEGNMIGFLSELGYPVLKLRRPPRPIDSDDWFGISQDLDYNETADVLPAGIDLIVIDHYGFDEAGESRLRNCARKMMVIDDLANRAHNCDLLLDQNLVEQMHGRYDQLIDGARLMLGPQFALVRPEFRELRQVSLARRSAGNFATCLVFMGGSDPRNDTQKVLEGIENSEIVWERLDIVVGRAYRGLRALAEKRRNMPSIHIHVQTQEMAELMAQADLAVTAGGTVSWEKCVLGLPSLACVQAENQAPIVAALDAAGALINLGQAAILSASDYCAALNGLSKRRLLELGASAAAICDGAGTARVVEAISNTVYG